MKDDDWNIRDIKIFREIWIFQDPFYSFKFGYELNVILILYVYIEILDYEKDQKINIVWTGTGTVKISYINNDTMPYCTENLINSVKNYFRIDVRTYHMKGTL